MLESARTLLSGNEIIVPVIAPKYKSISSEEIKQCSEEVQAKHVNIRIFEMIYIFVTVSREE